MENMAEKWLKKNDPLYSAANRRMMLEYPYLTRKQIFRRSRKEIPVSNLDTCLAQEWTGMGMERLEEVQELFT